MTRPPTQSRAVSSPDAASLTRSDWRLRCADRRQGFSVFVATLNRMMCDRVTGDGLEAGITAAARCLAPIRTARLIQVPVESVPSTAVAAVERFPVPTPLAKALTLEVIPEATWKFDEWDRTSFRQAAGVLGMLLTARGAVGGISGGVTTTERTLLIGTSRAMCELREGIERVAATDFTVLVEGESGSGKELVARQVHGLSRRHRGPFVAVNCAALVETLLEAELFGIEDRVATGVRARRGKFELADQGTLFLDEVADLSLAAQAKLLRVIQEFAIERVGGHSTRDVDVRLVVATNQRLRGLVDEGRFRADLYYRLAGVELLVPPLRERREDVVELANYFLARHEHLRHVSLSDSALEALVMYEWPGNVRELQRAIERIVALNVSDVVEVEDLPLQLTQGYMEVLQPSLTRLETMRAWGSRYARLVLERCGRNKRRACGVLGISYHTLQSYLRYSPTAQVSEAGGEMT